MANREPQVGVWRNGGEAALLRVIALLPIVVFSGLRFFAVELDARLLTGGALALLYFVTSFRLSLPRNPVLLGVNGFFVALSGVLLYGDSALAVWLRDLREAGMVAAIVGSLALTHVRALLSERGGAPPLEPGLHKPWLMLGASLGLLLLSYATRGNESIAGGIPVGALLLIHAVAQRRVESTPVSA